MSRRGCDVGVKAGSLGWGGRVIDFVVVAFCAGESFRRKQLSYDLWFVL
jgi:hypothetical protein